MREMTLRLYGDFEGTKNYFDPSQPRDNSGKWAPGGVAFQPARHDDWKTLKGEGAYAYHATTVENAQDILADGELIPHSPDFGTDQEAWPDGSTRKRTYLTDEPGVAWQFAPEHGKPLLLRVKREKGQLKTESTGDLYSQLPMKAGDLEAYGADGTWHPLSALRETPVPSQGEEVPPASYTEREMTLAERRCNFTEIQRVEEESEVALRKEMARIIGEAVRGMVAELQKRKFTEYRRFNLAKNPPFSKRKMIEFRVAVRKKLRAALEFGWERGRLELGKKYELVQGIAGMTWPEAQAYLDGVATLVASENWQALQSISTPILSEGIRYGKSMREITRELDEAYMDAGLDDEFDAARLATTARTNFMDVFNEGRFQAFRDADEDVAAYQYSAIMDGRTSEICMRLDGLVFSKAEADKWWPPNHYNCRSVVVPILTGETYELSAMPDMKLEPGGFLSIGKKGRR